MIFSLFIIFFNRGFFSFTSLFLVISLLGVLIYLYLKPERPDNENDTNALFLLVLVSYILFLYTPSGIYQSRLVPAMLINFLSLIFFPVLVMLIFSNKQIMRKRIYFLFLILAGVLRILIIISSPNPSIDVFTILKEAPIKLLNGINPYTSIYSQVYPGVTTDYYPYFPYSFLIELPWILIFKDPRILLSISDVLAAFLIYLIGRKSYFSELLSLIYLFRPHSLFIIEQSWLTPLLFLLTELLIIALVHSKNRLIGIILALISGIQPLFLIYLPITFSLWKRKLTTFYYFIFFLAAAVLPFFIWQPQSFIDRSISVYFKPLSEIKTIPVHLSLNINTAIFILTGRDLPSLLTLAVIFSVFGILFLQAYKNLPKKHERQISRFLLLGVIFFYFFYLLFRQSFINYYYYAGSILILWLALKNRDSGYE